MHSVTLRYKLLYKRWMPIRSYLKPRIFPYSLASLSTAWACSWVICKTFFPLKKLVADGYRMHSSSSLRGIGAIKGISLGWRFRANAVSFFSSASEATPIREPPAMTTHFPPWALTSFDRCFVKHAWFGSW